MKAVANRLRNLPGDERPDAVYIVESGVYSGCKLCGSTVASSGNVGMLAFANDLAWLVRNVTWAAPRISPYLAVVGGEAG